MADETKITLTIPPLSSQEFQPPAPRVSDSVSEIGLMLDVETLGLGSRAIVTQIGLYGFSMETEELLPDPLHIYLPIQPQLDLVPPRTITAETLVFWMDQSAEARAGFERNLSDEFEELPILMRQFVRRFNSFTKNGELEYELIAKGPQFDAVLVETLLADCGMRAPWRYDRVTDLRTLMRSAGVHNRDITPPIGFIAHRADWDCKFQIKAYFEAKRKLRARG